MFPAIYLLFVLAMLWKLLGRALSIEARMAQDTAWDAERARHGDRPSARPPTLVPRHAVSSHCRLVKLDASANERLGAFLRSPAFTRHLEPPRLPHAA